ncbi:ATP-binding protein [Escherichia coli]
MSNAIKFTDTGCIVLHVRADGDYLSDRVRDTGVAFRRKKWCACLIPSSRSERAYSEIFQGTGLGLAICEKLISMMDGDISVDSEPGMHDRWCVFRWHRCSVPGEKRRGRVEW